MVKFRFFIILLLTAGLANAVTFSVGVSPNVIFVGDVTPGETKIVKFSIFSVSDEPILVHLSAENSNFDFFNGGHKEYMPQFSEEFTSEWVEFLNNPVEIDPEIRKAGRGWVDINFLLHVPDNAEPGYHIVYVSPIPKAFGQIDVPVGTSLTSMTKVSVIINVKGDAKREGAILDTTVDAYSARGLGLKTFFQNTGSLTLYAVAKTKIYGLNGTFFGEFQSSHEYVKPKKSFAFDTPIFESFPEGEYKIESKVLYTTGEAEKTNIVSLSMPITGTAVAAPTTEFSWMWVILIVIIIIIAAWWYREKRR